MSRVDRLRHILGHYRKAAGDARAAADDAHEARRGQESEYQRRKAAMYDRLADYTHGALRALTGGSERVSLTAVNADGGRPGTGPGESDDYMGGGSVRLTADYVPAPAPARAVGE